MNLVLISLLTGFICTFLICSILAVFSALEDIEWRDWLTLWPYQHWFSELKNMFFSEIFVFSTAIFSFMFWIQLKTSMEVEEVMEATASREECVCNCKACKNHSVKTNLIANPINK